MGLFDAFKKKTSEDNLTDTVNYSDKYFDCRNRILNCTSQDIHLALDKDDQVYIAVFDIPDESGVAALSSKTLGLVFGLNTHLYFGDGSAWVDLEKNDGVMKAMMALMVSSSQVLGKMQKVDKYEFYSSKKVRAYLKTRKGVYFKELDPSVREDAFLLMLMNRVVSAISDIPKGAIDET